MSYIVFILFFGSLIYCSLTQDNIEVQKVSDFHENEKEATFFSEKEMLEKIQKETTKSIVTTSANGDNKPQNTIVPSQFQWPGVVQPKQCKNIRQECIKPLVPWEWSPKCPTQICWYQPKQAYVGGCKFELYQNQDVNYPPRIYTSECSQPMSPCYRTQSCLHSDCYREISHNEFCPNMRCQRSNWYKVKMPVWVRVSGHNHCGQNWYTRIKAIVKVPNGCKCLPWKKPSMLIYANYPDEDIPVIEFQDDFRIETRITFRAPTTTKTTTQWFTPPRRDPGRPRPPLFPIATTTKPEPSPFTFTLFPPITRFNPPIFPNPTPRPPLTPIIPLPSPRPWWEEWFPIRFKK